MNHLSEEELTQAYYGDEEPEARRYPELSVSRARVW